MQIAIIETGGKQYLVKPGQKIEVEKLPYKIGEKFDFEKVLLLGDEIGKPYLENAKIPVEVINQKRQKKIIVFRYHNKTRYRKKKGHRQPTTVVIVGQFPA